MTTSVFDRLAYKGTTASNARVAEEREKESRETERRAAEAAALTPRKNPAKLEHLRPPQPQIKSPKRTPREQDAFFSRLAKQETASSAAHHSHHDNRESLACHAKSPKKSPRSTGHSAVFNRLYKHDTVASKAHHLKEDAETSLPRSPKKVSPAPPQCLLKRPEHKTPSSPPVLIKMNLHIRSKEEKKRRQILQRSQHNAD